MAYTAGDTILDDEYNAFVGNSSSPFGYNHIAGTGSGQYGLGQTEISTVSAGGTVQASQWNSLFTGLDNIANHTNQSSFVGRAVSAGDTIGIASAVATDLATIATAVAAGSTGATAKTTSSALQTVTTGSEGWDNTAYQEVSVTFSNANQMRWFFNAGGKVRITVGATASVTSAKDTAFVGLGNAVGNLDIGSQSTLRSGAGHTTTTNGLANGFHDLGTSYTTLLLLTQSSYAAYNANTLRLEAKLNAAVGTATVMTVKMTASDAASDTQFTSGNTSSIPTDIKNTPKMVTTLFTINPTTAEGLSVVYTPSTTNTVSNDIT